MPWQQHLGQGHEILCAYKTICHSDDSASLTLLSAEGMTTMPYSEYISLEGHRVSGAYNSIHDSNASAILKLLPAKCMPTAAYCEYVFLG
jgi:hypothetical protein